MIFYVEFLLVLSPYKNNNNNIFVRSCVDMTQLCIVLYSSFKYQCYTILRRVFDLLGLVQWRNKVLQHDQQYKQSGRTIASLSQHWGFKSKRCCWHKERENWQSRVWHICSRKLIMIFYVEFLLSIEPFKNNNCWVKLLANFIKLFSA